MKQKMGTDISGANKKKENLKASESKVEMKEKNL